MRNRLLVVMGSAALLAGLLAGPALASSPSSASTALQQLIQRLGLRPVLTGCAAVVAGAAHCDSRELVRPDGSPFATSGPSGYGPSQLRSAYALSSASGARGGGQTVALVDAFDDPNAEADLAVYRTQFGLGTCTTTGGCFRKVNESGVQGSYPAANAGWATEISLDLDMVSAICPHCNILLVEASSNSVADLAASENTAARLGATEISNSYGGSESSSETAMDAAYTHAGVAITASTGDGGYGVDYPASSPLVTAVGGTTLSPASNARGWTESAWSGAGAGCSAVEAKKSWQTDPGCARRTVADVSADADPNTGVAIYDSYGGSAGNALLCSLFGIDCPVPSGWLVVGGTSVSSPIIASVYALAGNASTVTGASFAYSNRTSLNDVTTGSDGGGKAGFLGLFKTSSCGSYLCNAGVGYDGPTGLGTPNGTGAF